MCSQGPIGEVGDCGYCYPKPCRCKERTVEEWVELEKKFKKVNPN